VVAAPAALLVAIGAIAALRRPGVLIGAGWVSVLGAAGLVVAWAWSVHGSLGRTSGDELPFVLVGMAQAAVAGLGVAFESASARRRPLAFPVPVGDGPAMPA
jgi:hypothetical protein